MDAKITKKRLSRMLSYDWIKIIACAAALIFVWVMIFTMTETRVIPSQEFKIANYLGNVGITEKQTKLLGKAYSDDVLSFEVLSVGTEDLTIDKSSAYELLQARVATNELDIMFVSKQDDPDTEKEVESDVEGEEPTYEYTSYRDRFVRNYCHSLHRVDEYLNELTEYLNGYYNGDYENGELDEELVEKDFRARCKKKKDKRYKTKSELNEGVEGEIDRVKKYRKALMQFNDYLEKGYVVIENTQYPDDKGEDQFKGNGNYSVNICPSSLKEKDEKAFEKLSGLRDYVGYRVPVLDENGEDSGEDMTVATDMCVNFFNSNGKTKAYRFEGLIYVTYLLDTVLSAE